MTETQEEEPQVVWENTVDNQTWRVWVERISSYKGRLQVAHMDTDEVILNKEVGLAYQAIFGPDVADVALWEDLAVKAIDAQEGEK
jgi:hypothetical protein